MIQNFLYMIYSAMARDQSSLSQMQIVDGNTALLFTKMEEQIYAFQNGPKGPMQSALTKITAAVNSFAKANTKRRQELSQQITMLQAKFQQAQTTAQNDESQADALVQNAQTQTGQDSSNLQQKVGLAQTLNQITSYLSNILAQTY